MTSRTGAKTEKQFLQFVKNSKGTYFGSEVAYHDYS